MEDAKGELLPPRGSILAGTGICLGRGGLHADDTGSERGSIDSRWNSFIKSKKRLRARAPLECWDALCFLRGTGASNELTLSLSLFSPVSSFR